MRFVDTSFWIALTFRDDPHHADAAALWATRGPLLSTNHVLGETWTFLRRRSGHAAAVRFLTLARATRRLNAIHVEDAIEGEAWRWLRRHDESEYSFVDATSFAVMRRLRISEALAFDADFSAAGFVEARP